MKKVITVLLTALLVFALVACGGSKDTIAGAYKIKSLVMGGQAFSADDLAANGVDISDFKMELKDNGNFAMNIVAGDESQTVNGTWTADGNKVLLTAEEYTQEATVDGNTLTVYQDGDELVFEK